MPTKANFNDPNFSCEFGRRYSLEFNLFRTEIKESLSGIKTDIKKVSDQNVDLFNHQSSKIDPEIARKMAWLYGILGSIVGGIIIGCAVLLVTKLISQ